MTIALIALAFTAATADAASARRCADTRTYIVHANSRTSCSEAHAVARAVGRLEQGRMRVGGRRWVCVGDPVNLERMDCMDRRSHWVGLTGKLA